MYLSLVYILLYECSISHFKGVLTWPVCLSKFSHFRGFFSLDLCLSKFSHSRGFFSFDLCHSKFSHFRGFSHLAYVSLHFLCLWISHRIVKTGQADPAVMIMISCCCIFQWSKPSSSTTWSKRLYYIMIIIIKNHYHRPTSSTTSGIHRIHDRSYCTTSSLSSLTNKKSDK